MDSSDFDERLREFERQIADAAKAGLRENVPDSSQGATGKVPDTPPSPLSPSEMPPPPHPGVTPRLLSGEQALLPPAQQSGNTFFRRFARPGGRQLTGVVQPALAFGFVLFVLFLVFHSRGTDRRDQVSTPLTVLPGGNLTASPSGETISIVCDHADVTIGGDKNRVHMIGHCTHLTVEGSDNKVIVDGVDFIDTDGRNNQVLYNTGVPKITNRGSGNNVARG
jgi:hypothetical protein